ncbi:hypothetical protein N8E89_17760 [Phyllobacterium sp. A18/5-2]|uniref:hypothetical protein n=1 Tax=Phyllobacterium sp. A18/5-2 TaxID=2978392 RepID=UPI0021C9C957|nr:hypothetical protein [Phyllobacterium sp. A18/5-2]UXN64229.1 hypothetical protein N8E89_17760 [Phyllobacterium sp. A18/5-2]
MATIKRLCRTDRNCLEICVFFDNSINPVHLEMPNAVSHIHFPALFVWFGEDVNPVVMNLMSSAGVAASPAEIKRISLSYKYYPDKTDAVSYVIVQAR